MVTISTTNLILILIGVLLCIVAQQLRELVKEFRHRYNSKTGQAIIEDVENNKANKGMARYHAEQIAAHLSAAGLHQQDLDAILKYQQADAEYIQSLAIYGNTRGREKE